MSGWLVSVALVLAWVGFGVGVSAQGELPESATAVPRPPVRLELDPCLAVSVPAVRRLVSIDLDARLLAVSRPNAEGEPGEGGLSGPAPSARSDPASPALVTTVWVRCAQGAVAVEVDDPMTGSCLMRRVPWSGVADAARVRTLAMVIVEAVAASWIELAPGVDQSPVCAPRGGSQAASAQDAARRSDQLSRSAWLVALGVTARRDGAGAASGERCVPAEVRQKVRACPEGPRGVPVAARGRAPASRLTARRREVDGQPAPPQAAPRLGATAVFRRRRPTFDDQRLRVSQELLLREVELTEQLLRRTSPGSAELPGVLLRLSQLHEDAALIERARARELDGLIVEARRGHEARRLEALLAEERRGAQRLSRHRLEAIEQYQRLADQFPNHRLRDEVLFRLGTLLDEARPTPSGGEVAFRALLRDHPESELVAQTFLLLAERRFEAGEMEAALSLYDRAVHDESSPVFGYGLYRRAWCQINLGHDREAVSDLVRVIQRAQASPGAPLSGPLRQAARAELIAPYSRVFSPDQAWRFFERVDREAAYSMMDALARRYLDQGQWDEAAVAYRRLVEQAQDSSSRCLARAGEVEALRRVQAVQGPAAEVGRLTGLLASVAELDRQSGGARACRQEAAELAVDVVTSWHQDAVGTEISPGTHHLSTLQAAAELYQRILSTFDDLDGFSFEGWPAQGRPSRYRLRYWQAELLFHLRRWAACGPAFDQVVEADPAGEYSRDAAYASVLCWDNLYRQGHPGAPPGLAGAPPSRRALDEPEQATVDAMSRFVCQAPQDDELTLSVTFRRATVLHQASHFEEAAELFGEIVEIAPGHEVALAAAQLRADALGALARLHPGRLPACYEEIDGLARRVLGDEQLGASAEAREHFGDLRFQLRWARAERAGAEGDFARCAEEYLDLYRDQAAGRCRRVGDQGFDGVLYNGAICLESDYRIGQAIQVRQRLLSEFGEGSSCAERWGHPSELARRALHQIGGNYHAIAAYTKAANAYEAFARRFPGEAEAPEALRSATAIRLGLGQEQEALRDSGLFERNYGRRLGADAARVVGAVGAIYLHQRRWPEAVRHYRAFLRRYEKRAPPDQRIGALVNLGYALRHLEGDRHDASRAEAVEAFRRALALADRGRPEVESTAERLRRYRRLLGAGAGDAPTGREKGLDAEQTRRLVLLASAIGKARFLLAEEAFERFTEVQLPPFRPQKRLAPSVRSFWAERVGRETARRWEQALRFASPQDRRRQLDQVQFEFWSARDLTAWVHRAEAARARAEEAYLAAVREDVPEWEIASAARVGQMYQAMMGAFHDAPLPPQLRDDDDLRRIYESAIDDAAAPYQTAAVRAYEHCLGEATRNRWFNEWSHRCEQRLNELEPRAYPIADEFRATPTHTGNLLAIPSLVTRIQTPEEPRARP